MGNSSRRMRMYAGVALSALILGLSATGSANAQAASDAAQIKALQAQIDQLQRTVKQLAAAQEQTAVDAKDAKKKAGQAQVLSAKAEASRAKVPQKSAWGDDLDPNGHRFLERKKGKSLTFYTPGGEITAYGQFDVSIDGTTKNAKGLQLNGSSPP